MNSARSSANVSASLSNEDPARKKEPEQHGSTLRVVEITLVRQEESEMRTEPYRINSCQASGAEAPDACHWIFWRPEQYCSFEWSNATTPRYSGPTDLRSH